MSLLNHRSPKFDGASLMPERVQKILAQWGIASRRQAEQLIQQGRVLCNGTVVSLGAKVDPTCDRIEVDQRVVNPDRRPDLVYLLLSKPRGVVSTCHDPQGRRTVLDLVPPDLRLGLHPVGRLDTDSSGALILTNDGDLTFYLTHPRHQIPKTYQVWVTGYPSPQTLARWGKGIVLSGRKTLPAKVRVIKYHPDQIAHLEVVLLEGRNRQVRRVAELLGHPVIRLHRSGIGSISLSSTDVPPLGSGHWRFLSPEEVAVLRADMLEHAI
jgi:23S rRNA pseudouridine2605 synthase